MESAALPRRWHARQWIFRVEARRQMEHGGCILGGQRKHGDAIERAAGRNDAARAQEAAGRLQPDDVVEGGRDASRPRSVGAEGKADETRCNSYRRTRARAAGNEPRIERIAWHAVRRARARQSGGELIEIGLAQQHGTGLKQSGHDGGRCRRGIGERGAGRGGRHARDIDIVLNRKRNAEEWQALD